MNNDTVMVELRKAECLIEKERKDLAATTGVIAAMKSAECKMLPIETYENALLHWSNMLTMSSLLIDLLIDLRENNVGS